MKIAISGTHGVGKTSLAHSLVGSLREKGVHAVVNAETVRMCPLPAGTQKNNSVDAQTWVIAKQLLEEIELDKKFPVVICDRSVLCNYAYFLWALEKEPQLKDSPQARIAHNIFKEWVKTYDFIFKLPISEQTTLTEDGFRSTKEEWQQEIDRMIDQIIKEHNITVYSIPLDKNEKRVQKIVEIIKPRIKELQI